MFGPWPVNINFKAPLPLPSSIKTISEIFIINTSSLQMQDGLKERFNLLKEQLKLLQDQIRLFKNLFLL